MAAFWESTLDFDEISIIAVSDSDDTSSPVDSAFTSPANAMPPFLQTGQSLSTVATPKRELSNSTLQSTRSNEREVVNGDRDIFGHDGNTAPLSLKRTPSAKAGIGDSPQHSSSAGSFTAQQQQSRRFRSEAQFPTVSKDEISLTLPYVSSRTQCPGVSMRGSPMSVPMCMDREILQDDPHAQIHPKLIKSKAFAISPSVRDTESKAIDSIIKAPSTANAASEDEQSYLISLRHNGQRLPHPSAPSISHSTLPQCQLNQDSSRQRLSTAAAATGHAREPGVGWQHKAHAWRSYALDLEDPGEQHRQPASPADVDYSRRDSSLSQLAVHKQLHVHETHPDEESQARQTPWAFGSAALQRVGSVSRCDSDTRVPSPISSADSLVDDTHTAGSARFAADTIYRIRPSARESQVRLQPNPDWNHLSARFPVSPRDSSDKSSHQHELEEDEKDGWVYGHMRRQADYAVSFDGGGEHMQSKAPCLMSPSASGEKSPPQHQPSPLKGLGLQFGSSHIQHRSYFSDDSGDDQDEDSSDPRYTSPVQSTASYPTSPIANSNKSPQLVQLWHQTGLGSLLNSSPCRQEHCIDAHPQVDVCNKDANDLHGVLPTQDKFSANRSPSLEEECCTEPPIQLLELSAQRFDQPQSMKSRARTSYSSDHEAVSLASSATSLSGVYHRPPAYHRPSTAPVDNIPRSPFAAHMDTIHAGIDSHDRGSFNRNGQPVASGYTHSLCRECKQQASQLHPRPVKLSLRWRNWLRHQHRQ
ncbi:unnamed protein product [Sympodiomycopsis kandeliae]